MAKIASVNVDCSARLAAQGCYELADLLYNSGGWSMLSCGTGTAGVRSTLYTDLDTDVKWAAATNTWMILYRGSVYVTLQKVSTTNITFKVASTAPTTVGNATTPDSQVTAANEVTLCNNVAVASGASRCHAISFDNDQNTAGIRSFYLFWTDGSATPRGIIALEALANGTFSTSNSFPFVCAGGTTGTIVTQNIASGNSSWSWWYSPSSVWVPGTRPAQLINNVISTVPQYIAGLTGGGADPWDANDPAIPLAFGRITSQTQPGFVGLSNSIKLRVVARSYPDTVNLATDAYVYLGEMLIPWADNVAPI